MTLDTYQLESNLNKWFEVVAKSIDDILNLGAKILYEKYLEQQIYGKLDLQLWLIKSYHIIYRSKSN